MQIIDQLLLENNVAFHSMMGSSYKLNDTGREIIVLLKEHKTKDEIVTILSEKYNQKSMDIFIDVSDFFAKLKIYGLV